MWPWLSGAVSSSPRDEVLIGETTAKTPNSDGQTFVGGVILGRHGNEGYGHTGAKAEWKVI